MMIFALGVAVGLILRQPPENRGDVINFAGAVIGAVLTIIGAIIALDVEKSGKASERRDIVVELLKDAKKGVERVRKPAMPEQAGASEAFAQGVAVSILGQDIDLLKTTLRQFPPLTIPMIKAYAKINQINFDEKRLRALMRPSRAYGGITDFGAILELIEFQLESALSELGEGKISPLVKA